MQFSEQDFQSLRELLLWRRDVRRFKREAVPAATLDELLDVMHASPSVGNSQPWRWVSVESSERRYAICDHFEKTNNAARIDMPEDRQAHYASLKLAGLKEAPHQYAVYCDEATEQGGGLGRATMPQTAEYSVVCAIMAYWLAARARGVGVGWVSIIKPEKISEILDIDRDWKLVAYLCVGWPEENHLDPELERANWQARTGVGRNVIER